MSVCMYFFFGNLHGNSIEGYCLKTFPRGTLGGGGGQNSKKSALVGLVTGFKTKSFFTFKRSIWWCNWPSSGSVFIKFFRSGYNQSESISLRVDTWKMWHDMTYQHKARSGYEISLFHCSRSNFVLFDYFIWRSHPTVSFVFFALPGAEALCILHSFMQLFS
mgnify:CR=1 FL=1